MVTRKIPICEMATFEIATCEMGLPFFLLFCKIFYFKVMTKISLTKLQHMNGSFRTNN